MLYFCFFLHHGLHAENKKVVQALYGYNVNKHIHKPSWRLNTIITLNFKHLFLPSPSLRASQQAKHSKGDIFQKGRLSKTEVCTEYFPLIFSSFSHSPFSPSLPRRNVYFSSLRESPGGSGPDLGAHNSPGPASLMKFKLTAA